MDTVSQESHPLFITIEGIEGAGKSTAMRFLEQCFQSAKLNYIVTREPGGTMIAEAIRHIVLNRHEEIMNSDTELLLMFAGRAQHIQQVINPALAEGKFVICDRFTDATYAYQGGGRGISNDRIAILESWVQGGLQPDLTILLDIPFPVSLRRITSRGQKDRIEQEKSEFFQRVRAAYLARAQNYPERFRIIDASQSLNDVQDKLKAILMAHGISSN
jgi:dTMP kinase